MTSTEVNLKDRARRLHTEGWKEENEAVIEELIAPDYIEHSTAHPTAVRGPEGFKQEVEELRAGFPDLTVSEDDTLADGNKVASRVTFQGTHEGEFQGLEPTGQSVEFEVIAINRFAEGKVVEAWVQADVMGLMEQLDVG